MKKVVAILLAAILCMGIMAGCAPSTPSTPSTPSAPADTGNAAKPADDAKVYDVTISCSSAETTSLYAGCVKYKEILEATGKFKVNIYPNAQLGGDREALEGVQNGNITIHQCSSAPAVNFVQAAAIFDMPFVFANLEDARKVLSNENFLKVMGTEYEKAGFHLLGFADQGFRTLTLNKAVKTPEDMKGVSIRTMENQYHMEVWRSIGANPTPLAFNELYTALQQNTVDGQENPIELIHSQKFYEQQKYIIKTNHILQTINWVMNKAWYDALPEDLKKVIDDAAPEVMKYCNNFQDEAEGKYVKEMEAYGTQVIELTADEQKAFADKATGVWSTIEKDVGSEVYNAFMDARK